MNFIFIGVGKQAKNILLSINKNKDLLLEDVNLIATSRTIKSLDSFEKFAKELFPKIQIKTYTMDKMDNIAALEDTLGFITTPPKEHKNGLLFLKKLGVNKVILEKPIASSLEDFNHIVSILLEESHKQKTHIQEQYLYSYLYEDLRLLAGSPSSYFYDKCNIDEKISILYTKSEFYKKRIKDYLQGRHAEHICLIELPHILTIISNIFGNMQLDDFNCEDYRTKNNIPLKGYKNAFLNLKDREGILHIIKLSNDKNIMRRLTVFCSNNFKVVFEFPGKLKNKKTKFFSKVVIYNKKKLIYNKIIEDDHLAKATRSYLLWKDILGNIENCYWANKTAIELSKRNI